MGFSPAHCGAAKGQIETLKILQNHGGNLWLRNVKGDFPYHEAIASGRRELVLWFLQQNPDAINIGNNDGRCALHIAAMYNDSEMIKVGVQMLAPHAFHYPTRINSQYDAADRYFSTENRWSIP